MKKYKVKFYTTFSGLSPEFVISELMLDEILSLPVKDFIKIDDYTEDGGFILNTTQLVGIVWERTQDD